MNSQMPAASAAREDLAGTVGTAAGGGGTIILVILCSLNYFLDGLVHSIMGPLAPAIARDLHLTRDALGPIFSANLIGQCIGLVIIPLFVRRMGHRRVLVLSITGFGLAQALTALSSGGAMLLSLRVVTGFFLGGALPSCLALVAAKVPSHRRGTAISLLFTGYGLGAVVSGIVAGMFLGNGSWRTAMVLVGAACLVAAASTFRWLDDSVPPPSPGTAAAVTKASAIVKPPYLLGSLMLWVMFIAMLTINYCLNSWLPTLLTDVGRDAAFAALSTSIFAAGGLGSTLIVGSLIDRFGTTRVLGIFLIAAAACLYLIGYLIQSAAPSTLLLLLALGGFSSLGAYGGINVVLAEFYPGELRAVGVGWTKSIGRLGTVVAPILIGRALATGMSESTAMSLFAVPAVITLIALLIVGLEIKQTGRSTG